ncbi:MAG: hypothetical protein C0497_01130 [Gemmatimonas sp.]|nr:hypothetical protein [Gemmatimonas sp.]
MPRGRTTAAPVGGVPAWPRCNPSPILYPLPSTLYPLPSTLYPLPSTLYPLPSTLYPLPSALHTPRHLDLSTTGR